MRSQAIHIALWVNGTSLIDLNSMVDVGERNYQPDLHVVERQQKSLLKVPLMHT